MPGQPRRWAAHHRQAAGDSVQAEAVKVLVRAHQRLIWDRHRQANVLRVSDPRTTCNFGLY